MGRHPTIVWDQAGDQRQGGLCQAVVAANGVSQATDTPVCEMGR